MLEEDIYATHWPALTAPQQAAVAVRATRLVIEDVAARGWRWWGWPINAMQALPVPRSGFWDREGNVIASNVVPVELKRLIAELCEILAGTNAAAAANGPAEQSISMGRLSVTYAVSGAG